MSGNVRRFSLAALLALICFAATADGTVARSRASGGAQGGVAALWVPARLNLAQLAGPGVPVRAVVRRSDRLLLLSLQTGRQIVARHPFKLKRGGMVRVRWRLRSAMAGPYVLLARAGRDGRHLHPVGRRARVVLTRSTIFHDGFALWHMDEPSGTTMHDSVGTHNGTLHNVQLGVPGSSGLAYRFNGSSSYVSVPSANDLNPGGANVTITVHIQATGTPPPSPADWDLIRKGVYDTSASEFKMELQQSGQASCGFKGSTNYSELMAGPKINDGQWHTVQCVKTSSAIEVIVDGNTFSKTITIGSISNTNPVVIGAYPGSDWYSGALDEASIQIG